MIAKVQSAASLGIHAFRIDIEVDISNGLPQLNIVGLPDTSVKESRERIRTAIKNSGYSFPQEKITINLAPADIKKEGPAYDFPMAIATLAASGVLSNESLNRYIILGELALDGSIRPFKGALVIVSALYQDYEFIFPEENAHEASMIKGAKIYPVKNLNETFQFLTGEKMISPVTFHEPKGGNAPLHTANFSEVKGQLFAKRAIEIGVAGGHNLLFIGPPGAGKTMLARRIPTILPPLDFEEALEISKIYSNAGIRRQKESLFMERPFRSPHATSSAIALVGGGSWPKPGEVSLAHGGVLFLDEFPEFRRDVIESLRNPLEEGFITISRAKMQITYPARIMLVAAMNPCPCGFLSDPRKVCRCTLTQIRKYQNKISGPILDRIDLHVEVPSVTYQMLTADHPEESSETIRGRIVQCRKIQAARFRHAGIRLNAMMRPKDLKKYAQPNPEGSKLIERAMKELQLSARAYYRILKIARTIADLEPIVNRDSEARSEASSGYPIAAAHIAEAIQYRSLDRQG